MNAWVHTLVVVFLFLFGAVPMPARVVSSAVSAPGSPPADPGAHGRAVIERAIAAHGGREAWRGKRDVFFSTTWTHFRDGRPRFSSRYLVKFPTSPASARAIVEGNENGKPVLMGISGNRAWFRVGDETHDDAASLKANRAFVKKAYMLLALPFLLDDPAYRVTFDGHEVRSGVDVDRVRVEHGLEPTLYLLFESVSGRFAGMGSVVAESPTTTLGEAHDHEIVQGILIPRSQSFDRVDPLTGRITRALSVSVDAVRFNNGFGEETFEPPL